jgi:hypothetical protein
MLHNIFLKHMLQIGFLLIYPRFMQPDLFLSIKAITLEYESGNI